MKMERICVCTYVLTHSVVFWKIGSQFDQLTCFHGKYFFLEQHILKEETLYIFKIHSLTSVEACVTITHWCSLL